MSVEEAVKTLAKAFKDDESFRIAWQANIAMAFVDDCHWYKEKHNKKYLSRTDIHAIANTAADRFLAMLK